jgi:hypothetical protein
MSPRPLSFWNQVQLTLIRWLSEFLGIVDGTFHVHWGEWLLERMSNRWQTRLLQLDDALAHLQEERDRLQSQGQALALRVATIYLGRRKLARYELRFDPADPHDEKMLDASIELLVKDRLASIETQEIEQGHYIYYLEPDWVAIRARLTEAANQVEPRVADLLQETIEFMDDALLSEPVASSQ